MSSIRYKDNSTCNDYRGRVVNTLIYDFNAFLDRVNTKEDHIHIIPIDDYTFKVLEFIRKDGFYSGVIKESVYGFTSEYSRKDYEIWLYGRFCRDKLYKSIRMATRKIETNLSFFASKVFNNIMG